MEAYKSLSSLGSTEYLSGIGSTMSFVSTDANVHLSKGGEKGQFRGKTSRYQFQLFKDSEVKARYNS